MTRGVTTRARNGKQAHSPLQGGDHVIPRPSGRPRRPAAVARRAAGCATLLKIARAEKDANFRRRLFGQVGEESSRAVPALLAEGNFTNLETLLELGVTAEAEAALPGYAAYCLLRGRLDDAVTRW